jgi:hypothetical protein
MLCETLLTTPLRVWRLRLEMRLMDVTKVLQELHFERDRIDQAILTLERLIVPTAKRRGRPPRWMVAAKAGEINAPSSKAPAPPPVN